MITWKEDVEVEKGVRFLFFGKWNLVSTSSWRLFSYILRFYYKIKVFNISSFSSDNLYRRTEYY